MSTIAIIFVVLVVVLLLLVIGNLVFSIIAERKNPPAGKFIECEGVRVHYREWGDATAPCVVLFHGNGTMIQDFSISGLVDLLARRNRVLCFDRPGFGHTQRPRSRIWTPSAQAALFVKVLKQIGARDPVVVGHSWGTLVAVALGLRGDSSVRSLVLASTFQRGDLMCGCCLGLPSRSWATFSAILSPPSSLLPSCPQCSARFSNHIPCRRRSRESFRFRSRFVLNS